MKYREYRAGDTISVTGCQGRLFRGCSGRKLAPGVPLGVECVLESDEDSDFTVRLPKGILQDSYRYISVACIELVQAVEDKTTAVEDKTAVLAHIHASRLFRAEEPESPQAIAKIWYDSEQLPKEVAKAFAESIKATYDSIVGNRKTKNQKVDRNI